MHGHVLVPEVDGLSYEIGDHGWWRVRCARRSLMVVDEIGTRVANDVRLEAMWQLLEARQGLPTVYTGNLDAKGLQSVYDERIVSRLAAGTWIELVGPDRRAEGFGGRSIRVGA